LYLAKAKDLKKDQSYFLYRLTQDKLKHILFPLGDYTKQEVRQMAQELQLPVAQKAESQEICFIPGVYQDFLRDRLAGKFSPGPIVDMSGKVLGMHKGIPFYTVGQRDKLGIACGYPIYIVKIDPADNIIVVGKKEDAVSRCCRVSHVVWPSGKISRKKLLSVRIRHLSPESPAWVKPIKNGVEVTFKEPKFAITPGQSAVFYHKDVVVGGGIIEEVVN
jgi:tRNA-specific 2-thiouridylase